MFSRIRAYVKGIVRRNRIDTEVDAELRFHIEMSTQANIERGMAPEEARRVARVNLGGATQVKEGVRDLRTTFIDALYKDVRFALRTFRRNPGFTAVAVITLALGIGATTAIFSVVNAVLIRPLPYQDPVRLAAISATYERAGVRRAYPTVSLNQVEYWREQSHSLQAVASFVFTELPVRAETQAMFLVSIAADPELLETLGVQPAIGRNLAGHGSRTPEPSVLISHRLWSEIYGRDRKVLGRSLTVDGAFMTIGGVLPASFKFPRCDASYSPDEPDLILPVANIAESWGRDSSQWFAIARLKPGVSLAQANGELGALTARYVKDKPDLKGMNARLSPLDAETTGKVRSPLLLTLGISLVLLLIACTNIMNLLFSRAAHRGREVAVRKAVGATTGRLVRQMLTENACLTSVAGAIGVMLAQVGVTSLVALSPAHLPLTGPVAIDWTVLGFTFGVCAVCALLAGALPAIHHCRQTDTLIATPRSSLNRGLLLFQGALMVAQIALGVGLLSVAGVLAHSLLRLNAVNPGFATERTLAFELAFASGEPAATRRLTAGVLEAVRGAAGVKSAGWITNLPPETRSGVFVPFGVPGAPVRGRPFCNLQVTSEDYFSSAGIRFARGRDFTRADSDGAAAVAVINETLARQYFPNADPLGRTVALQWEGNKPREVVGVIHDIHDRGLSAPAIATIYVPFRQFALAYGGVLARTTAAPEALISQIRRRVAAVDPSIPLKNFSTIAARVQQTLDGPRFYTVMAAACALMALLFVTLGLYGLVSYQVSRRTAEIGIRMALGAPRQSILRRVLLQGLRMALFGVGFGMALSAAVTRLLRSLLFEVKPIDPLTLALAAAFVIALTLVASFLPALRASRIEPLIALRYE